MFDPEVMHPGLGVQALSMLSLHGMLASLISKGICLVGSYRHLKSNLMGFI
jgi:hypothetical protein